jgi:hypothetical protein
MRIKLTNGSMIQIIGSDNYDQTLVGVNAIGIIFSEYALTDPRAYQFARPILSANNGFAMFVSTPRGKNHLFELFEIARDNPEDWFANKLTIEDTNHIPLHEIQRELASGEMSEDLVQQEYYCSFDMGVEGSYYSKYMDRMRLKGQIGMVPWEPSHKVHTAWDLGMRDSTSIIFFQCIGQTVRIIDYYEKSKEGLEHYIKVLQSKEYSYSRHMAPHDIRVRELGTGMSRLEKAKQLGINFTVAPDVSIVDGIEAVRSTLPKCWIDETKCAQLIKALENYRQEFDAKHKVYKANPLHNQFSHACFVGGTKLLTRYGMRQIMDIKKDDEILTLYGWKKCNQATIMKKDAELVEVRFQDGTTVKCTPEHLFLTESGWKSAKNLNQHTRIQSSLMKRMPTLQEESIRYGLRNDIYLEEVKPCIAIYGNMLLDPYQKDVTYTIKTAIQGIITYGIWNASQKKSILHYRDQMPQKYLRQLEIELLNGTDLQKEYCGIDSMHLGLKHGQNLSVKQEIVYIVTKLLKRLLDIIMFRSSAIPTAKPLIIESVNWLSERADVYCINVPEVGHFSLSNGAIVHNSDAMRYLAISLPKTRDGMTAEEVERQRQEAILGPNRNMPAVFRSDLPGY